MLWQESLFNINIKNGDTSKKTNRKLAKYKNDFVFQQVFARLLNDALTGRYKINGIPETCSERVVMQSLLWHARCLFFDKEDNILALPGNPGANLNIYGDFGEGWVYGANGYNEHLKLYIPGSDEAAFLDKTIGSRMAGDARGVMIRENAIMYPFINTVIYYAECIADTLRTLDVCRANIKQPFIIVAEESIVESVKRFFETRNDNVEYIISSGVFPADKINLLPFETNESNLTNATALIDWYEQKFREQCGINNNANIDKKGENLISDEIAINEDYTRTQTSNVLEYLQQGLDDANKIFGLNMTVEAQQNEEFSGDETDNAGSLSGDNSDGSTASYQ